MSIEEGQLRPWLTSKRWYKDHPELGQPGRAPVEPYISAEQFALEKEHLWPNVWLKVGRVEDIPDPGDYLVKDIPPCDTSLMIVRGRDKKIRAFHNICPHRGSMLCWEESGERGSTAAIKCPFHGFSFDLTGKLRWVPEEENFYDFIKDDYGLKAVHTDVWEGFIFVHLGAEPRETLKEFLGEMDERLSGHPFHEYTHYYEYKSEVDCNWKVMIAGFLENYHTATLHQNAAPAFTTSENPFSRNLSIDLGEHHRMISMFGNPEAAAGPVGEIAYGYGAGLIQVASAEDDVPGVTNPTNSSHWSFDLNNIFPNFQLNVVNGAWYTHSFWPLSADKMIWETRLYFSEPKCASERFYQEYSKVAVRDVLMEDGVLSERIQHVIKSGVLDHFPLQDEEVAIQHFNHVVEKYTSKPAKGKEV